MLPTKPVCIERHFNLDGNNAYLAAAMVTTSRVKPVITIDSREYISPNLLESTPMPQVGKYLSWQRTLSPSIFVPHSDRCRTYVRLLSEFQKLADEEMEQLDKKAAYLVKKSAVSIVDDEEIQSLENILRLATQELAHPKDPFYQPLPVDDYIAAAYLKGHPDEALKNVPCTGQNMILSIDDVLLEDALPLDDAEMEIAQSIKGATLIPIQATLDTIPHNISEEEEENILEKVNLKDVSEVQFDLPEDILLEGEIPDEFFKMVSSSELIENMVVESHVPFKEEFIENQSRSITTDEDSSESSKGILSNFSSLKLAPLPEGEEDEDEEDAPLVFPRKRKTQKLVPNSSIDPTPKKQRPISRQEKIKKLYTKFVDTQAECEGEEGSMDPELEESLGSLVDFIDDGDEEGEDDEGDCTGGSSRGSCVSAPSSEAMMAFYRRTAFDSQEMGGFATKPKQFAQKTRLRFQTEESDQSD